MERTYPPNELLGALTAENLQIAFTSSRLKLLIDAFRVWPQGVQFEVRTIEALDLYPEEFDIQSLTGRQTGHGLEVLACARIPADGQWMPLRASAGESDTSTGGAHRRRHITIWTPADVTAAHDLKVTASWPAAGMDERSLKDPTTVLAEVLVGGGDQFVSAWAEESPTTVILHVTARNMPGTYTAIGLMASEEITLQAPIGDRKVKAFDGSRVPEVSLDRVAQLTIDEVIARYRGAT